MHEVNNERLDLLSITLRVAISFPNASFVFKNIFLKRKYVIIFSRIETVGGKLWGPLSSLNLNILYS